MDSTELVSLVVSQSLFSIMHGPSSNTISKTDSITQVGHVFERLPLGFINELGQQWGDHSHGQHYMIRSGVRCTCDLVLLQVQEAQL